MALIRHTLFKFTFKSFANSFAQASIIPEAEGFSKCFPTSEVVRCLLKAGLIANPVCFEYHADIRENIF
jgi:hypothetical protein